MKENLVYAVELIACAVHPYHLDNHPVHQPVPPSERSAKSKKKVALASRPDIVGHLLTFLKDDGLTAATTLKAAVLSAMTELMYPLSDEVF